MLNIDLLRINSDLYSTTHLLVVQDDYFNKKVRKKIYLSEVISH